MKKKYLERTLEFHKIYEQEILPMLRVEEQTRKELIKKRLYYWIFVLFLCFLTVFIFKYWLDFGNATELLLPLLSVLLLGAVSLLSFFPLYSAKHSNFIENLKSRHLHKILRVFGDISWIPGGGSINATELKESALFPNFDGISDDDGFIGSYKDVSFKISETELFDIVRTNKGTRKEVIFKGIILAFESNKTIKNRTIVATKGDVTQKNAYLYSFLSIFVIFVRIILEFKNLEPIYFLYAIIVSLPISYLIAYFFRKKETEPLDEVFLEDPRFCKKFNVYSSDQVEARYLLTTSFIDRFQNLKTAFGAKRVKCSFFNNQIMFAISTNKNLFELANINKPLTNPEMVNDLYEEISAIYKMIEYFKLDEKINL